MKKVVFEACGIDVHKEMLNICLVDRQLRRKRYWELQNNGDGIRELISVLKQHRTKKVAFESTSIYWLLLHDLLEPHFDLTLANPRQIKAIPGRKTDAKDAEWIATLLVNNLIKKSYVPPFHQRQIREMCRLSRSLMSELSRYVNRQTKLLDQWNHNFIKHFSSYRTLTCQYLLDGLASGQSWLDLETQAPTQRINNELTRKRKYLIPIFANEFPLPAQIELRVLQNVVKVHRQEIDRLEQEIEQLSSELHWDHKIEQLTSIPGIGKHSAIALYAEIGEIVKFPTPRNLVAWSGLAPSVYQSAGKHYNGRITKQGNRHIRYILFNCIVSSLRRKNTELYQFYQRLRKTKPFNVVRTAMMAKILRIIHHLLRYNEFFIACPVRKRNQPRSISV